MNVEQHVGLVHAIARKMEKVIKDVEYDELVSAGSVGLMNAAKTFDTSRGFAFSTYAMPRIRGAILDDLRRNDTVSRGLRRTERLLTRTQDRLGNALGRAPTAAEMADALNVSLDQLEAWRLDAASTVSREVEWYDASPLRADEAAEQESERQWLWKYIGQLNPQERDVLSRYYFAGQKLHEIAADLESSESRISQVRSRALARLREQMNPQEVAA